MSNHYIWQALYSPGFEHLQLDFGPDAITADSVVVFTNDNIPTSGGISQAAATHPASDAATPEAGTGAAASADAGR